MGLYFGSDVYLKSSWNILDGFLVFVSLVDILVSVASAGGNRILGMLRVLRLLRTLRPLRQECRNIITSIYTVDTIRSLTLCVSQGDKPSSRFKAGGRNSDHISQTYWKHCPHLLCFFHCVWNSGSPGKHLYCLYFYSMFILCHCIISPGFFCPCSHQNSF